MITYILSIISFLLLIIILPDLYLSFNIWYKRIHIGRWSDRILWKEAILKTCVYWIKNTPTVKLKDNNKYIIVDLIRGKYRINTIQSLQEAGLILGLISSFKNKEIEHYIKDTISSTGNWKKHYQHIDSALLAYAILQYAEKDNKQVNHLHPAMDYIYNLILSHQEGITIKYRKNLPYIRFVDTLGLICPFLIKYGILYNKEEALTLALNQLIEYDNALLEKWYLPCHAFDTKAQLPRGIYDWGRGIGWYILALVEGRRSLSPQNKIYNNFKFADRIIRLATTLMHFQHKNGGFSAMIFDNNPTTEGSITTLTGLLFHEAWLISKDIQYKKALDRTITSLMSITQRNGRIDLCQGDTKGIGYYSNTFTYMPFIQGLALLLINRINEEE